ncbi:unnamed protein product [Ilex paraguariensis]|uniref:F-box domain-containing protein n=1 Tax=Ilex paraguariensis TaxID=185542 RepID=A0ABC8UTC5_9AQUA
MNNIEETGDGSPVLYDDDEDLNVGEVVEGRMEVVVALGKKRKKMRRGIEPKEGCDETIIKEGRLQDPLIAFGSDIMMMILSHLDVGSVALSLLVSPRWNGVASNDRLWTSKLYKQDDRNRTMQLEVLSGILRIFEEDELADLFTMRLNGKIFHSAISMVRIVKDDLYDHAWEFHFNEAAPDYWPNLDPYREGIGPPMRRYFHPDGSQSADPGDKV